MLEGAGLSVYPLNVSAAFHTKFVEHAKEPFSKAIKKEKFHPAKGKVFSNTTAQPYPAEADAAAQVLSDHILNSVRFQEEIEAIYEDGGRIFVEIGPKNVLSNLVKDILGGKPHEIVTFNPNTKGDSDLQFRQAVLQLRVLGFELSNIDPNKAHDTAQKPAPSKVAVMLNGGLYKTESTKRKFEQALKETTPKRQIADATSLSLSGVEHTGIVKNAQASQPTGMDMTAEKKSAPVANPSEIENLIEKLQTHQTELLRTHEQFLKNDNTSKTLLQQITGTELSLLSGNSGSQRDERMLNAIEKQAESLTNQHEATSSAHQAYIQSQTEFTRQYAELIQRLMNGAAPASFAAQPGVKEMVNATAAVTALTEPANLAALNAEAPAPVAELASEVNSTIAPEELSAAFLAIVSDKTGYPVDMLELDMDMEADLGIDSIKRVEILGAMQEQYPDLPSIETEDLVELRTLAQVIGAFKIASPSKSELTFVNESPVDKISAKPTRAAIDLNSDEIQEAFLKIVSDKTGYPVDMLELDMDMEADLGIDSIKRVEILGSVQEKYPNLPSISAEELVELRTLSQITNAFAAENPAPDKPQSAQVPVAPQSINEAGMKPAGINADEIKTSFLEIVSEKTGYPTDMLELDMDMEADLGIDSIKRVEILGAVQEKYPDLPSISAEDLVGLRTLRQIIESFNTRETVDDKPSPAAPVKAQPIKPHSIAVMPVTIRQLPRPDQVAVDYPEGSSVLISAEDYEKANLLAEMFSGKGIKVGIIRLSPNGKKIKDTKLNGFTHYTIEDGSENGIETLMQRVANDHEKIVAFFHLEPSHNGKNGGPIDISDEGERSLKSVFLLARHLKAPLAAAAGETRPAFITVTQMDGQFGLNGCDSTDPLPGGFAGLTKSLRQEWPNVFCRALDFHPDFSAQEVAEKIQDELCDSDLRLVEVGYTPEGRFTVALMEEGLNND